MHTLLHIVLLFAGASFGAFFNLIYIVRRIEKHGWVNLRGKTFRISNINSEPEDK